MKISIAKKKILSVILSIAMIITMLPLYEAKAADVKYIRSVDIRGFEPPYAGEPCVAKNITIITDQGGGETVEVYLEPYWKTKTSNTPLTDEDVFVEGTEYQLFVAVVPKEGYAFADDIGGSVTKSIKTYINGSSDNVYDTFYFSTFNGIGVYSKYYTAVADTSVKVDTVNLPFSLTDLTAYNVDNAEPDVLQQLDELVGAYSCADYHVTAVNFNYSNAEYDTPIDKTSNLPLSRYVKYSISISLEANANHSFVDAAALTVQLDGDDVSAKTVASRSELTITIPLGEPAPHIHKAVVDKGVNATCLEEGISDGSHCEKCGAIIIPQEKIPAKGHKWGEELGSDATNHWSECIECHEKEVEAHTPEYIVTKEPTYSEEGEAVYKCTVCKKIVSTEKVEVLPPFDYDVIDSENVMIRGYFGSDKNVVIPEQIDGKNVSRIYEGAFSHFLIESVVIPGTVKVIEDYAFEYCEQLTSVTLMEGIEELGEGLFCGCKNLKSVDIPASVNAIERTFRSSYVTKVNISEGNTAHTADDNAIYAYDGAYLVEYYGKGKSFKVPDGVEAIGLKAFHSQEIEEVIFPEGLTYIGEEAFDECYNLKKVNLPEGLTAISDYAFWETAIENIVLPESLEYIGEMAFADTKISSVDLKNVECIDSYAFYNAKINEVVVPKSLVAINPYAFTGCPIDSYVASEENPAYSSADGYLLDKDKKKIILAPSTLEGSYEIPSYVTEIGYAAFNDCTNLTRIDVGKQVTNIDMSAFSGCYGSVIIVRNPDCKIGLDNNVFGYNAVIIAPEGSMAMKYATGEFGYYGHTYVPLKEDGTCVHYLIPDEVIVPVGCLEDGLSTSVCAICGEPGENIVVEARGYHEDMHQYFCIDCFENLNSGFPSFPSEILELNEKEDMYCSSYGRHYTPHMVAAFKAPKTGEYKIDVTDISYTSDIVAFLRNPYEFIPYGSPVTYIDSADDTTDDQSFTVFAKKGEHVLVYIDAMDWYLDDFYASVKISLSGSEETTISLDKESVIVPTKEKVTLTATVNNSQKLTWTSSNEKVATVDKNGVVTALTYGKATITATTEDGKSASCEVNTLFFDVAGSNVKGAANYQYYFDPVYWAAKNGITTGYDGGIYFGPQLNCERRALMTFLWRMMGSPQPKKNATAYFADMGAYGASSAANKAVAWAYEQGITKGYSEGGKQLFKPAEPISRKDTLIMLYRVAGKPAVTGKLSFSDTTSYKKGTDTYNAILWASNKSITGGYKDGTFKPNDECLREHIVTFLYRYNNIYKVVK